DVAEVRLRGAGDLAVPGRRRTGERLMRAEGDARRAHPLGAVARRRAAACRDERKRRNRGEQRHRRALRSFHRPSCCLVSEWEVPDAPRARTAPRRKPTNARIPPWIPLGQTSIATISINP